MAQHRIHRQRRHALRRQALAKERLEVAVRPALRGQRLRPQVGGVGPLEREAGQMVAGHGEGEVAGRVTLAAMAQHVDEIMPVHRVRRGPRDRRIGARGGPEQRVPETDRRAQVEGEHQVRRPVGRLDRRLGHQPGIERVGILAADLVVAGIGHRRVEVAVAGCHAPGDGAVEVIGAPRPDAVVARGRDVGAVDGPDRGHHRIPAAQLRGARGVEVASHAVPRAGDAGATLDQRLPLALVQPGEVHRGRRDLPRPVAQPEQEHRGDEAEEDDGGDYAQDPDHQPCLASVATTSMTRPGVARITARTASR